MFVNCNAPPRARRASLVRFSSSYLRNSKTIQGELEMGNHRLRQRRKSRARPMRRSVIKRPYRFGWLVGLNSPPANGRVVKVHIRGGTSVAGALERVNPESSVIDFRRFRCHATAAAGQTIRLGSFRFWKGHNQEAQTVIWSQSDESTRRRRRAKLALAATNLLYCIIQRLHMHHCVDDSLTPMERVLSLAATMKP